MFELMDGVGRCPVRSTEEYLKLAGSGQLPQDHVVFLPNDII